MDVPDPEKGACLTRAGNLAAVLPADITAEYATAIAMPHESHGSTPTASIFPGSLAPASAAPFAPFTVILAAYLPFGGG